MSSDISGPSVFFLSRHSKWWDLSRRHRTAAKQDDEAEEGKKNRVVFRHLGNGYVRGRRNENGITSADEIDVGACL